MLLAEEGGIDAGRQQQAKGGRCSGQVTSSSQDPRVGELTSGRGPSLASLTSSAGIRTTSRSHRDPAYKEQFPGGESLFKSPGMVTGDDHRGRGSGMWRWGSGGCHWSTFQVPLNPEIL